MRIWITRDIPKPTSEYLAFWTKPPYIKNGVWRGGTLSLNGVPAWIGDMTEFSTSENSLPEFLKLKKGTMIAIEVKIIKEKRPALCRKKLNTGEWKTWEK